MATTTFPINGGYVETWNDSNGLHWQRYDAGGTPVGGMSGSSWHVKGAGDFNGDGMADVLWQNDTGQTAIWTMNGFTQLGGGLVGTNPGSSWHVLAMGS
jgi:hypothetical protein